MLECSYSLEYVAAVSGLNRPNITAHEANFLLTRKVLAGFNILNLESLFLQSPFNCQQSTSQAASSPCSTSSHLAHHKELPLTAPRCRL